jgi:hypothetical protein
MAIYSPLQFNDNNLLPIALLAASGLLLLIIVYYIVISKTPSKRGELYNVKQSQHSTDMASVMSSTVNDLKPVPTGASYSLVPNPSIIPNVTVPKTPEVFNIKENIYTIDDAPAVCGALGAQVATIEQLIQAHKNGADWCNVGWTKDGIAAYPIQQSTFDIMQQNDPEKRNMCGKPGINMVRNDPNLLYGVNCYGVKPTPKGDEKIRPVLLSDTQVEINAKIAQLQKNLDDIGVVPFNSSKWNQF